ncbi:hypothetical protein OIE62_26775 [Streptomyces scopuliridis]|uniref:Uncharacterized protein n=1 Tax=Streptomyces scopuliridis TaxID=452529 RepID=A0ACD4ZIT0_9ACTN|nr:hypothetical protein [Streptomyces scopuliridis]WSB33782.1 hypothetical protein OG949_13455 [Streptomyces scopuliridis]WSB98055.1 hypothetical protein OG835_14165 [Streptomyces scopuliridis]WSC08243.1 hypothetical protein OIE62_26775 [Streptomyces scopuliridis]
MRRRQPERRAAAPTRRPSTRWLTLYARSRQVPASLAAALIATVAAWSLTRGTESGDPRTQVLLLTSVVAAAAVGLSGQDRALDRTAAIRWAPRRAAHVLFIGVLAGAVLLALPAAGDEPLAAGTLVRNSAGAAGLAAIGAALWGGQYAWTLPFGWCAVALFVPPTDGVTAQVATWLLQPSGTTVAGWTAVALAAGGGLLYALAGPRR